MESWQLAVISVPFLVLWTIYLGTFFAGISASRLFRRWPDALDEERRSFLFQWHAVDNMELPYDIIEKGWSIDLFNPLLRYQQFGEIPPFRVIICWRLTLTGWKVQGFYNREVPERIRLTVPGFSATPRPAMIRR